MTKWLLLRMSLCLILSGLSACAQGASPPESPSSSRWTLGMQGEILWNLTDLATVPHKDHMAMSGRSVDMIIEWQVDAEGHFSAQRLIRWPMLRTLPDNTHASLQRRLSGHKSPAVSIEGQTLSQGRVTQAEIHDTLKVTTDREEGLTQTRTIFTGVHAPVVIDLCQLTNTSSHSLAVNIVPWKTTETTDPKKGRLGSYVIEQCLIGQTQQTLAPGEGHTYALIHRARLADAAPYFGEPDAELAARQRFIETLEGRFPAGKANLCTSTLYYDALLSSADLGRALSKDPAQLRTYLSPQKEGS